MTDEMQTPPQDAAETPAAAGPAPDIERLEAALADAREAQLRAMAEADNVRKRAENEVQQARKFALERFCQELLPVKDSLESALASDPAAVDALRGGVELTLKQLAAVFDRQQLAEINPAGEKFDPNLHQAMGMVEAELPPNTVASVLQKGYRLHERVLRPALVMVSKNADDQ